MITLPVRIRLHVRVKEMFRNIVDNMIPLVHNCQLYCNVRSHQVLIIAMEILGQLGGYGSKLQDARSPRERYD
jgi:hypothetical protein